jgi:hypothetical protein
MGKNFTVIFSMVVQVITLTKPDKKSSIVFINIPAELLTRPDKGLGNC